MRLAPQPPLIGLLLITALCGRLNLASASIKCKQAGFLLQQPLGRCQLLPGPYDKAIEGYQQERKQAASRGNRESEATAIIGEAQIWELFETEGCLPNAERAYRDAISITDMSSQEHAIAANDLGVLLLKQQKVSEALVVLREINFTSTSLERRTAFHFNIARALELGGNWNEAYVNYLQSLETNQEFKGAIEGALRTMLHVANPRPDDVTHLTTWAIATSDENNAITYLLQLLQIRSGEPGWSKFAAGIVRLYRSQALDPAGFEHREYLRLKKLEEHQVGLHQLSEELRAAYFERLALSPDQAALPFLHGQDSDNDDFPLAMAELLDGIANYYLDQDQVEMALSRFGAAWRLSHRARYAMEYVSLLSHHKELDPSGSMADIWEKEVFPEPGDQADNDWSDLRRFRVALATILEERGSTENLHSAIKAWQQAISASEKERSRNAAIPPAAGLDERLATCYFRIGDFHNAVREWLAAAKTYVDIGDTERALDAYNNVSNIPNRSDVTPEDAQLILSAVSAIREIQFKAADLVSGRVIRGSKCSATNRFGSAAISGQVIDRTGAVVAGAHVTVTSSSVGIERSTLTDSAGCFLVGSLPPDGFPYRVSIEPAGFRHLLVNVMETASLTFELKPAAESEVVEVSATAPILEPTMTTVGTFIDGRQFKELAILGRSFLDLVSLSPGVNTPDQGFPPSGPSFNTSYSPGNVEDTVNFMINGINLNNMVQSGVTFQPSTSTISEVTVENSISGVEYGRSSHKLVNIATRSGTNNLHGELFEFIRNDVLDARNFFNPVGIAQSPFKSNQFGANLGGPIKKNATFYFLSYQGFRLRQGLPLSTSVLTMARRNQIIAVGNSTSQAILALIPVANDATGTKFIGSATAPMDFDQGSADISHQFSSRFQLHGYYGAQRDLRLEPTLRGNSVLGFGETRQSKQQIATIGLYQAFSANLVNETRLGINQISVSSKAIDLTNPLRIGIGDGNNFNSGLPQITIGGTGINLGGPAGLPQRRADTIAVVSDLLSYVRGRHVFKVGGEFQRLYSNNLNSDTGTLGFLNVTDFANGQPNAFTITAGNVPSRIAMGELGLFVQDNWRVSPRLALNLGLRYDWSQTPTEAVNRFANLIIAAGQANLLPTKTPYQQNMVFQPRLGLAFDLFGTGKTIVQSTFAVTADQPITNLVTPLTANPPFANPKYFVPTSAIPRTSYTTLLADAAASGQTANAIDPYFENSYLETYSLHILQQLSKKWSMNVGYFGSEGHHLPVRINLNQFVGGIRPFTNLSTSSPVLPGATIANISENVSFGNSSYNALWISSELHPWHGLQFGASYHYSKSLDDTPQTGQDLVPQNSLNPAADRGLSDFDARHRFAMNIAFEVPALRKNRFFEGWQIASIVSDQSGNPVNIVANGLGVNTLTGVATLRPDLIGPVRIVKAPLAGGIQYFAGTVCDPFIMASCPAGAAFSIPDVQGGSVRVFHFGNLGRNVVIGPGFNNVDFSLTKRTRLSERFSHEMRFEALDLFNHPNFGQPGDIAQVDSATFGVISSTRFPTGEAGSSRQLQFSMRVMF